MQCQAMPAASHLQICSTVAGSDESLLLQPFLAAIDPPAGSQLALCHTLQARAGTWGIQAGRSSDTSL